MPTSCPSVFTITAPEDTCHLGMGGGTPQADTIQKGREQAVKNVDFHQSLSKPCNHAKPCNHKTGIKLSTYNAQVQFNSQVLEWRDLYTKYYFRLMRIDSISLSQSLTVW